MQIRLGNRQDEAAVRSFIACLTEPLEHRLPDFATEYSDFNNIEANYIGHDGIFLVAEEDKKIIGMAAALSKSDSVCLLKRFFVAKNSEYEELSGQLLQKVINFARQLDYADLEIETPTASIQLLLEQNQFKVRPETDGKVFVLKLK